MGLTLRYSERVVTVSPTEDLSHAETGTVLLADEGQKLANWASRP